MALRDDGNAGKVKEPDAKRFEERFVTHWDEPDVQAGVRVEKATPESLEIVRRIKAGEDPFGGGANTG